MFSLLFFFFKQKTAYEMRISDWSSDVCSSDLLARVVSKYDGFYATHMRDEGKALTEAVSEAIEIGEKAGVKVEIFHLKNAYAPNWGKGMQAADRKSVV